MNYTTKQLADLTNSELIGDGSLQVTTISFDSRTIYSSADNAFIAINTKKNSGEKYIHAAIDKGIKIIISFIILMSSIGMARFIVLSTPV